MHCPVARARQINRISAWLLLGLSIAWLLWSVLQLGGVFWLDRLDTPAWLAEMASSGLLGWLVEHALALSTLQLLACLPCVLVGLGMLRLHDAARSGFIVLLLLTAALNLASLPLLDRLLIDLVHGMARVEDSMDAADAMRELAPVRAQLWVGTGVPVLALVAAHGWLAWRYAQADMRTLYRGHG